MSQGSKTLYALKPLFVTSLEPVTQRLARTSVSPQIVTLTAIPVAVAVALLIVAGSLVAEPLWLLVAPMVFVWMAINAIDGRLARLTRNTTARGAILNELVDRSGDDLLLLAGFAVAPAAVVVVALVGVAAAEIAALINWAVAGTRTFAGPMGKPDRATVVAIGAAIAMFWSPALTLAYLLIAVGAIAGTVVRSRRLLQTARALDRGTDRVG